MRILTSPNYEEQSEYSLRFRSADQNGQLSEHVLVFPVIDVNEPPTNILTSSSSINLNSLVGDPIASFSSVDPDITDSFEYSFVSGAGSTHNAFFSIQNDQLILRQSLASYDDIPEYSIRLQSIDAAGGFVYKTFTFPVNHFPTDILLSEDSFSESIPGQTPIGSLVALDSDHWDSHVFTLVEGDGDSDNHHFEIVDDQIVINHSPDFEEQSQYTVRISATDSNGLSVDKIFVLNVMNELEDSVLLSSTAIFNLPEDVDDSLLEFSISDLLVDQPQTFELVEGEGDDDNALFILDGSHLKFAPLSLPDSSSDDISDYDAYAHSLIPLGVGFEASDIETIVRDDDHVFYIVSDDPQPESLLRLDSSGNRTYIPLPSGIKLSLIHI